MWSLSDMLQSPEVKRPKVGEEVPSEVRAEVRWSLTGVLSLDPQRCSPTISYDIIEYDMI